MRRHLFALIAAVVATSFAARAETVLSFSPRGNQAQFYALMNSAANPVGSVVLLAGGNGRIDIQANGTFLYEKFNQVVRTRKNYPPQGLITVLPDIAADFKVGQSNVVSGYRATFEHAQDIGAVVTHLRNVTGKPVLVMGTSRGSIGVSNVVSKMLGLPRPDGAVITSGFLSPAIAGLNVRNVVFDNPNLLAIPMIAVVNIHDACPYTKPSELIPFATWYAGNGRKLGTASLNPNITVDVDPCGARTPHGFWGWDAIFVLNLSTWMKQMIANLP